MKSFLFIPVFILIMFTTGCQPKPRPIKLNRFKDINLQKIHAFEYDRKPDSLLQYLNSENAEYRREAALSFSSIQDSSYLENLYRLLKDPDKDVRKAAAFSIGQTGTASSQDIMIDAINIEQDVDVQAVNLEALGRVATMKGLQFLTNFTPLSDFDKGGKAWGIYRAGLNDIKAEQAIAYMLECASSSQPFETRLAAGHYFYRMKTYPEALNDKARQLSVNDTSPAIRMIYTRVLSGFLNDETRDHLLKILQSDSVYNVRISAINALKPFHSSTAYSEMWKIVQNDPHISVRLAAAQFIARSELKPQNDLINLVQNEKNEIIRATLLGAFMNNTIYKDVYAIASNLLIESDKRFEKQQLLASILKNERYYQPVLSYMQHVEDRDFILAVSYEINGLLENGSLQKDTFYVVLKKWLQTDNPYLVRQAAWFLCKPSLLNEDSKMLQALEQAKDRFSNYRDKTVPNAIAKAQEVTETGINVYASWEPEYFEEPETFEKFNWNKIVTIPADLKIDIYTEKGKFTMQLMVEDAPITVTHFIELIQEEFYEGAPFYRVIPNYVKQAGGSKEYRFDKPGSERIRSELNPYKFRSYTVVMASYGRDTESSHFAIMISPAPWNDHKYTVFARITGNKEVVQNLMPGDLIYGMEILNKYKI